MKDFIKEYFTFPKGERKGILALLTIILALWVAPYFTTYLKSHETVDFTEFEDQIDRFLAQNNTKKDTVFEFYKKTPYVKKYNSPKKKTYQKKSYSKNYASKYPHKFKKPDVKIDINIADSITLTKIRGIGKKLSARIIRYRDILGGFIHKEQLKEIYGIDSARYVNINNQVFIGDTSLKRININTATSQDLYTHPYINYNVANAIINYRKQHGDFSEIRKIKELYNINEETFSRIKKYLSI